MKVIKVYHSPTHTLEEYLASEEHSDEKREFLQGNIFAMSGASPEHNLIVSNLIFAIGREHGCLVYAADQKVWTPECELVTYPDIVYACGHPEYIPDPRTGKPLMLTNPTLIVEVLSPSTEEWDREGKWECYQEIESLRGYLMVWQDRRRLEYRMRQDHGWDEFEAKDGRIQIPALDLTIEVEEVYRGIEGV